ncbi:MAG TPA: hypothetical protein VFO16_04630 [Pseudonocardiaceae bacterium]|nr:hypothetical protein [Pseudonocardiaceae bacterium]
MTDPAHVNQAAAVAVGAPRDRRGQRRSGQPSPRRAIPADGSRRDPEIRIPAPARTLPVLLAELMELGREAWRISERERAVRAEINALREIEEKAL